MKLLSAFFLTIVAVSLSLLAGCNAPGSSATAPTNVAVVAGDSSVTVSWDMTPGVQYWLFFAPASSVTPENCSSIPGCQIMVNAVSPVVVSAPIQSSTSGFTTNATVVGLTNGNTYSFTINGRTNGGAGGPGSPSLTAIPRLAGTTWTTAGSISSNDLHGVTKGTATIAGKTGDVLVAVGGNGSIFSSTDGKIWGAVPASSVPTSANLNAVTSFGTTYVATGAGGVVLTSTDAINWLPQTSPLPAYDLYAIASNGGGGFVAVGASGKIITSNGNGGTGWVDVSTGTSNLYGVTYANGMYVAVGASGTLLTSVDQGITWLPAAWTAQPPVLGDLRGVAYGGYTITDGVPHNVNIFGSNTFVVLGAAGTLITSPDGVLWTLQTPNSPTVVPPISNVNAVTYGHQFVAAGDGGGIYTSADGLNWVSQTSSGSTPLYAITHGRFDYSIVGGAGLNLSSM